MAKLIYTAIMSLDGYIADESGNFDWAEPDPEVHAFINDLERPVGTYLYGRRMYETMAVWQTMDTGGDQRSVWSDYADIWRSADKIVYSRTLDQVSTPRTRLERAFEPEAVRLMKKSAARDIGIGGPDLAAHAIRAGLVDAYQVFLTPVIIGSGNQALPDGFRQTLELVDERRFGNGMIYLHYQAVATSSH
jgi:dihydrofolate reductase